MASRPQFGRHVAGEHVAEFPGKILDDVVVRRLGVVRSNQATRPLLRENPGHKEVDLAGNALARQGQRPSKTVEDPPGGVGVNQLHLRGRKPQ